MKLNSVTRRSVILSAAGSIAATAIPATVRAADTPAKRKNIEALSGPELDAYKHAIQIVKSRSAANPNDQTGYAFWASLHDNFDDTIHSGCAHFSEKFFPWHRRFLRDFELVLQQTDPAVTAGVMIPYWDWTQPPVGGGHFPKAFMDAASPLFDQRILTKTPPPWDPADIVSMVNEHDWNVFAGKPDPSNLFGNNPGIVESGPHNTLHTNISRDMASPSKAVQDPIFWSFHSGIDLVWSRWQRLHVSDSNPQPFADPAAMIFFRDRSFTVASTAKTTDFGYVYDYDFSGDGSPPGPALVAQAPTPGITSPSKRTIALTPVASNRDITAQAAAPSPLGNSTLLRLAGVKVYMDKSYQLVLYLHPKDVNISSAAPQALDQYRMRVLTLWRAHHDGEVEMFVRPSAAQLAQLNQGWTVTVQSEAIPDEGGPPTPMGLAPPTMPLPATPGLLKSLELQER
jgi:Common central domain of tyrosinase